MYKKSVGFAYPSSSSFIKIDLRILRERYDVYEIYLAQDRGKLPYLFGIIRMIIAILVKPKLDLYFTWFADYHCLPIVLLCKLFGKKSVIFIGGYDAVHYPELGMGVHANAFRSWCNRTGLTNTSLIIANHESLINGTNSYYNPSGHHDGIKHFIPSLVTPTEVLYNAIDFDDTQPSSTKIEGTILCVGTTPRYDDIINKGYDLMIQIAQDNPQWNICLIGIDNKWLARLALEYGPIDLSNLRILPKISQSELSSYYSTSKVFVQASISEGMPNSLIEAMSYSCIPVGSDVAGIPVVIGKYGLIVKHRDKSNLAEAIKEAMKMSNAPIIGESIRERFTIRKRALGLFEILDKRGL